MILRMHDREDTLRRYLAIWNGEVDMSELDALVTDDYVGHIGSRDRNREQLKGDIVEYRSATPMVHFTVQHRFGEGEYLATRVRAEATDERGKRSVAQGLNISRWRGPLLAEEWAVWEPLHQTD